jgi:hypothetical protein
MCVPAYGYEIGSTFYEDCPDFENVVLPPVMKMLMYTAKSATAPYTIPQGPDVMKIEIENSAVNQLSILVTVSDSALTPFEDNLQAIKSVHIYVNEHPYDGAEGLLMTATDGAYDSVEETVTIDINTTDWGDGKYALHVQAVDVGNFAGPVSAIFVTANSPDGVVDEGPVGAPTPSVASYDTVAFGLITVVFTLLALQC